MMRSSWPLIESDSRKARGEFIDCAANATAPHVDGPLVALAGFVPIVGCE